MKIVLNNESKIIIEGTNTGLILKKFMELTGQNATSMKKALKIKFSESINSRINSFKKNDGVLETFLSYSKALSLDVRFYFEYEFNGGTKCFESKTVMQFIEEYMNDFNLIDMEMAKIIKKSNFSHTKLSVERSRIRIKKLLELTENLDVKFYFKVIYKK